MSEDNSKAYREFKDKIRQAKNEYRSLVKELENKIAEDLLKDIKS